MPEIRLQGDQSQGLWYYWTTHLYLGSPNDRRRLNPPLMDQRWLPLELLLSRSFLWGIVYACWGLILNPHQSLLVIIWLWSWILPSHLQLWRRSTKLAIIIRSERVLQLDSSDMGISEVRKTWQICWQSHYPSQYFWDCVQSTFSGRQNHARMIPRKISILPKSEHFKVFTLQLWSDWRFILLIRSD